MQRGFNWPHMIGGVLLVGLALVGLWLNQAHEPGTVRRMGPGYFPMLVFLAMAVVGVAIAIADGRRPPAAVERTNWRRFTAAVAAPVAFELLIEPLGLAAAIAAATALAAMATGTARPLRVVGLAVVLTAFCWTVFVNVLGIGIALFPAAG